MTPPTANARRREMVRERICYVCYKPCPEGRGLYYAGLGIMVHSDSECSALLHASMRDYSRSSRGRFRGAREIREAINGALAASASDSDGLPIVSARRISGGANAGRDLLAIECPFCGRQHVHGGPRKGAPIGAANGVRVAHCASSDDIREYRLREVAQ